MATKTISITEEAYGRLKEKKERNESFSDVVYKLTSKKSLLEVAGVLSIKEAGTMEKKIKEIRTLSNKRAEAIAKIFKE